MSDALALAGMAQASGNAGAGKQKASQLCAACHGPSGAQPTAPENPKPFFSRNSACSRRGLKAKVPKSTTCDAVR